MDSSIRSILERIGLPVEQTNSLLVMFSKVGAKDNPLMENALTNNRDTEILLSIISELVHDIEGRPELFSLSDKFLRDQYKTLSDFEKGIFWHLNGYIKDKKKDSEYLVLSSLNKSIFHLHKADHSLADYYQSRVHNTLGQVAHSKGLLEEAIQEFQNALKYKKISNDEYGLALTYGNLGRLYFESGEYEQSKKNFRLDLEMLMDSFPDLYRVQSQIMNSLGQCHTELSEYEEALEYFDKSTSIANKSNDFQSEIFALLGKGKVNVAIKQANLARDIAEKVEMIIARSDTSNENSTLLFYWYQLKGLIEKSEGRLTQTNDFLDQALNLLSNADLSGIQIASFLAEHSKVKEKIGLESESIELLKQALTFLDSTSAGQKRKELESILKEKSKDQWLLHAFSRFMGQEKLEELLDDTGLEGFSGKDLDLAILFVDIRGFTKMSEELQNNEIISLLNDFLERMINICHTYNGYVDKILGDALLVHFSIPSSTNKDCDHAAMCALHMHEEVIKMNRLIKSTCPKIQIGIGIHFGTVVAGLIGSASKRSFTVIGDAVNTSSRLEGLTKILGAEIIISKAFIEALHAPDLFNLLHLGKYRVYGRAESIELFALEGMVEDCPDQNEMKQNILLSQDSYTAFIDRDFVKAKAGYEQLYKNTGLKSYALSIDYCTNFMRSDPIPKWDGSIEITRK